MTAKTRAQATAQSESPAQEPDEPGQTHAQATATSESPAQEPDGTGGVAGDKTALDKAAHLSQEVLKSVEAGQRAAIEAVRKFVDTVDEMLPVAGDRPSRRETVINGALEMADKLVATQYDFLRNVVRSAEGSLSERGAAKK